MKSPGVLLKILLCSVVPTLNALPQKIVSLQTQNTWITVSAERSSPRVLQLGAAGRVPWKVLGHDPLVASVISDGVTVHTKWVLNRRASRSDNRHLVFVYENRAPKMELRWSWQARSTFGPVEHSISIRNLSPSAVTLPLQESLALAFSIDENTPITHTYIDKGAGKPSSIGTHADVTLEGDEWKGESSTYSLDQGAREIIPFSMIQRCDSTDGWYLGIEFSGRTLLQQRRTKNTLLVSAGLNPYPQPFTTIVQPQESFEAPIIFLGAFSGDADAVGNVLRPWIRNVLMNPETWKNSQYPLLVNNSWGSGMQVDERLARRMINDSADLGLEMFHLDAGWFRGVGDWYAEPAKFPSGLSSLANEAHRLGLKFGLWVNWAEAGSSFTSGSASVNNPRVKSWLVADTPKEWKPDEFIGRTIDLGAPEARDYAKNVTERIVTDYKLDMIEHDGYVVAKGCNRADHPHVTSPVTSREVSGSGVLLPLASNSTDVSYHSVRAYYAIQAKLRQDHPKLLFEICNDGGRMVDFGSAAHGDYFSITDSYDPISNRQAFFDASHVLPPAMLEDYVEKWPTANLNAFRYMLRSGMMGWLTIMQDTSAWTEEQHAAAKHEFVLYKTRLRPLIRDANLYHVSPRPDGVRWDGLEYFNPTLGKGVLYAFRGTILGENEHTFFLSGISSVRSYTIHFEDQSAPDRTVTGQTLIQNGVQVRLTSSNSSELIFIEEVLR